MSRIVTKRILGKSIIPKYNVRPPLTVTDSFDFFIQLENFGFIIEDVENEKVTTIKEEKKEENKNNENILITEKDINLSIDGGMDLNIPNEVALKFEEKEDFEGKEDFDLVIKNEEKKEENKNNKKGIFNKNKK